jgi:2-iminobutanoate/2-iminopropanoate deaminase
VFYKRSLTFLFAFLFAMMSLSACADNQIKRKMYNPWEAEIGYSQVVVAGNNVYLSGIASDKPTMEEQVREIYSLIQNNLRDQGLGMEHIVKQVIYTTDIESFKKLGKVRKEKFPNNQYPSSTLVEVKRLYSPIHLVEIEVIAFNGKA